MLLFSTKYESSALQDILKYIFVEKIFFNRKLIFFHNFLIFNIRSSYLFSKCEHFSKILLLLYKYENRPIIISASFHLHIFIILFASTIVTFSQLLFGMNSSPTELFRRNASSCCHSFPTSYLIVIQGL